MGGMRPWHALGLQRGAYPLISRLLPLDNSNIKHLYGLSQSDTEHLYCFAFVSQSYVDRHIGICFKRYGFGGAAVQ
jgi:hypothetical protein